MNDSNQNHDDRDYQENMDEAPDHITADQTQQP